MDLLNILFLLFSLIAVGLLCFYFYKLAQQDKEEWIKKEFEETVKELEAEEWLAHSFVPDVLHYIKKNPKKIIKYTFFILLVGIMIWSYAIEGLQIAVRNAFFTCIFFVSVVLYIYTEPRLFEYAKNHLPRKMRHSFDNDWIRAYAFFLLPGGIITFFLFPPFSLSTFLFTYTILFLVLIAATRVSKDIEKEEETHNKKELKRILKEEN